MEQTRPLDALNAAKGKRVIVDLKTGLRYTGVLHAFDIHINTVLNDAEEYQPGEATPMRKLGTVFLRGDAITTISTQ